MTLIKTTLSHDQRNILCKHLQVCPYFSLLSVKAFSRERKNVHIFLVQSYGLLNTKKVGKEGTYFGPCSRNRQKFATGKYLRSLNISVKKRDAKKILNRKKIAHECVFRFF